MTTCFVIPAYEPDQKLVDLLRVLSKETNQAIFVVDDGSSDKSIFANPIFTNQNITVLKHAINFGKGAALKTAFNYILAYHPNITGCVTLDADGQHSVSDALTLSSMLDNTNKLTLGVRNFNFGDKRIPLKSRVGNLLTRGIWRFVTGIKISDTQTGLRAIPAKLMKECLYIPANRYEFEMEMLLKAQQIGVRVYETPINTIYIDDNKGSHFNPVLDSLKIYFVILRYFTSSFMSCIVDYLAFTTFILFFSLSAGVSFILARLIAFIFNYNVNKKMVFRIKDTNKKVFFKYLVVFLINLYVGFSFIDYIGAFGYNAFYLKFSVEGILLFFNFFLQKEWVFKRVAAEYD
jgi:putative flippase GtrA